MLRRISTKLVLAVLLAVVLPFVDFAFYMNEQMEGRLTRHVAQQALLGLAKDLGGQADYFVEERRSDLEQWANAPWPKEALENQVPHIHAVRQVLERARAVRGLPPALPIPLPDDPRIRGIRVRQHPLDSYNGLVRNVDEENREEEVS